MASSQAGLLVVDCFECYGFLMKCLKSLLLLVVGFGAFSCIAVIWDPDIAIFGVQNRSFGRPGASISSPWKLFCQLGDTSEDRGSSKKHTWGYGSRFLMILK